MFALNVIAGFNHTQKMKLFQKVCNIYILFLKLQKARKTENGEGKKFCSIEN